MTEHDLDVIYTNLSIQVSLLERMTNGKTATDVIVWDSECMADPAIRFQIATMKDAEA